MLSSDLNSKAFNVLLKLVVAVPNAPTTMGITATFFICHDLVISFFNKLYFSIFLVLYHILLYFLVFPGMATPTIIVSFFTLSNTAMARLTASII